MNAKPAMRLLSRAEVEAEFGLSRRFLEISAVRGDGPPFVKVGRLARYLRSDVIAWIEQRRVRSTSQLPKYSPLRQGRP